ncbi:unnamed protein product [Cyprideis torosa]|uniref:Uncharacterized protein n=1 Tax=Cyprideis torosa TaxID=163714 RepID=A0A7R8W4Y6_9CRUS|nr:unnamed protein product [Cyprideis torosa]CAG0882320.1 unnamed protein product [Cyprideis torosa]
MAGIVALLSGFSFVIFLVSSVHSQQNTVIDQTFQSNQDQIFPANQGNRFANQQQTQNTNDPRFSQTQSFNRNRNQDLIFQNQDSTFRNQDQTFRNQDRTFRNQDQTFRNQDQTFQNQNQGFLNQDQTFRNQGQTFRNQVQPTREQDRFLQSQQDIDRRFQSQTDQRNFQGITGNRNDINDELRRLRDRDRGSTQSFSRYRDEEIPCPPHWVPFRSSCYWFKSLKKTREDAQVDCQSYSAELVSISDVQEHVFLVETFRQNFTRRDKWYLSARLQGDNSWVNDDGTTLSVLREVFQPEFPQNQFAPIDRNYLVYSFFEPEYRWSLERVTGRDPYRYVCEIPKSQISTYVNRDRDMEFGDFVEDLRYLPRGPKITSQPMDAVFDLTLSGSRNYITMTCLADAFPYPSYSWFKEDYVDGKIQPVKMEPLVKDKVILSGGTLIVRDPDQVEDRGRYFCQASNKYGVVRSDSALLSFGYVGEFNLKRGTETGKRNWGKAIYCDPPQAYPELSYYWARDFWPNTVEEDKRTFVSFDGHLYFSYLDNIDAGRYSCNVQTNVSSVGKRGPFFYLIVKPSQNYQQVKFPNNFPKAFPEAPIAGQDVRLECMAFGYPVPTYNWTRRYGAIPRKAFNLNYDRVLIIPRVSVDDEGEYICNAYNQKVSIEESVTLTIQARPTFTVPLADMHMDKGDDLTWICEAFGIPDVTYTWYKNGQKLLLDNSTDPRDLGRYEIRDNVLIIRGLSEQRDVGMYQCEASNQLGSSFSSGQLRVLTFAPSFSKHPLEVETLAGEGGNVTIQCRPEAAPMPRQFKWLKDLYNIGSSRGRIRVMLNGDLFIEGITLNDEGRYTCIAQNEFGEAQSTGRLVVLRPPVILQGPVKSRTAAMGEQLVIPCQAVAERSLDLSYIWEHNELELPVVEEIVWRRIPHDKYVLRDGGNLVVTNLTLADAGIFRCTAVTAVGKAYAEGELIVQGPPGPPGGIAPLETSQRSVLLKWTDGVSNGYPITGYRVEGRTNWNQAWLVVADHVQAEDVNRRLNTKQARLKDVLSPWSSYEFRVSAYNLLGLGQPSVPSPLTNTLTDVPYAVVPNVTGGGGNVGDLTIRWTPLSPQEHNAPGIHYKLFWRQAPEFGEETEFQDVDAGNTDFYVVRIPEQYFYTKYQVQVQPWNTAGAGNKSAIYTIYSAEGMPQVAPRETGARAFNSTCLNVSWVPIEETRDSIRGQLIGYRIKYWREVDKERTALYYLSRSTQPWALVVGLQPNTYYWVRAMAYNSAGQGPESERFLERTFKLAPIKPPNAVKVEGINPRTVRVTWRYVSITSQEEPLLGYKVLYWEAAQDISSAREVVVPLGGDLEAWITDLTPGKLYRLRVLAYSLGGWGKMSSPAWEFQMGNPESLRDSGTEFRWSSVLLLFSLAMSLLLAFPM